MDQKLCNSCKQYKDITEFSYRNITTQDTTKKRLLSICKACNAAKAKEHYYKTKSKHINYIYRFLNKNNEVIYIGKTETNLNIRINGYISKGHLPKECYDEISKIQFLATTSKSMMDIKEIYYINVYKPKYSTNYIADETSLFINDFQRDIWRDFNTEEIKALKKSLSMMHIY